MPDGAGHSHAWSIDVDSRIAAQLTANFTDRLTGIVQVISEHRADNSYTPVFEWANIKYAFTPDFSVRVGRTVLPVFLTSDYRKVGFTNPWVRPPIEVYNLVPISNNDGVDVAYRLHTGDVTNTIQGLFGRKSTKTVGAGTWDFMKNFDLTLQYEHIDLDAGSAGTLSNIQPGFQPGGNVNVFSVTIDFVF